MGFSPAGQTLSIVMMLSCALSAQTRPAGDSRNEIPAPHARAIAEQAVKTTFGSRRSAARTPQARSALARDMMQSTATESDIAKRYVLLEEARSLAIQSADIDQAIRADQEIGRQYRVDEAELTAQALSAILSNLRPDDLPAALAPVERRFHEAMTADRFDIALRMNELATAAANRLNDRALRAVTASRRVRVEFLQRAWRSIQPALAALQRNPTDPEANQTVGEFRCLDRNQWVTGLPLLAKGTDPMLHGAAAADLAGPIAPDGMVAAGDGWWDLAENRPDAARRSARRRAVFWYRRAVDRLSGLTRLRVQERIDEASGHSGRHLGFGAVGLVLYYSFEPDTITRRGDQTLVTDLSGLGDTGTARNVLFPAEGAFGTCARFQGSRAIIDAGQNPATRLSTAFTISVFVRGESGMTGSMVARDDWAVPHSTKGYVLRMPGGKPEINLGIGGWRLVSDPTPLDPGAWHHVAATYDETTVRLFVDEHEVAERAQIGEIEPSSRPLWIGNDPFDNNRQTVADLDEVMIFNRALTPAELARLAAPEPDDAD